jgi:hypothetical protein
MPFVDKNVHFLNIENRREYMHEANKEQAEDMHEANKEQAEEAAKEKTNDEIGTAPLLLLPSGCQPTGIKGAFAAAARGAGPGATSVEVSAQMKDTEAKLLGASPGSALGAASNAALGVAPSAPLAPGVAQAASPGTTPPLTGSKAGSTPVEVRVGHSHQEILGTVHSTASDFTPKESLEAVLMEAPYRRYRKIKDWMAKLKRFIGS